MLRVTLDGDSFFPCVDAKLRHRVGNILILLELRITK